MTTMTPDAARELSDLRRRAYGPEAGALETHEVERLRELEQWSKPTGLTQLASDRARRPPSAGSIRLPDLPLISAESMAAALEAASPSPRPGPRPGQTPGQTPGPSPALADAASDPAAASATPGVWWRRRSLWIAVAAGVVIGLVLSWGVQSTRDVRPSVTLQVARGDLPFASNLLPGVAVEPDTLVRYESWNRADLFTVERIDGARCLVLSTTRDGEIQNEYADFRCVNGGLDPVLDVEFWPGVDALFGVELSAGSTLRFVARNGVVDVWVQEPRVTAAE